VTDKPLIAYIRVSTSQQGRSGLAIEAQREILRHFSDAEGFEITREFVEVETGKGADATGPTCHPWSAVKVDDATEGESPNMLDRQPRSDHAPGSRGWSQFMRLWPKCLLVKAPHDNVGQNIPAGSNGRRQRPHTPIVAGSKNIRNHRPIVAVPVPPHIAAPVPLGSATQTAGAVTVASIAVTRSPSEAAANVIVTRTIASATATMIAAAGKCAGGKPGTSENKDNCKNNYGIAQHWRPL
jgi:hypothetical protein